MKAKILGDHLKIRLFSQEKKMLGKIRMNKIIYIFFFKSSIQLIFILIMIFYIKIKLYLIFY